MFKNLIEKRIHMTKEYYLPTNAMAVGSNNTARVFGQHYPYSVRVIIDSGLWCHLPIHVTEVNMMADHVHGTGQDPLREEERLSLLLGLAPFCG